MLVQKVTTCEINNTTSIQVYYMYSIQHQNIAWTWTCLMELPRYTFLTCIQAPFFHDSILDFYYEINFKQNVIIIRANPSLTLFNNISRGSTSNASRAWLSNNLRKSHHRQKHGFPTALESHDEVEDMVFLICQKVILSWSIHAGFDRWDTIRVAQSTELC